MCTHYLNALSDLCKHFLKEIFIPRHMTNTHSSHFVALHLNFFFADTYVFYVPIKDMSRLKSRMKKVGGNLMSDGWQSTSNKTVINVILGVDGMLSLRLAADCSGQDKTMCHSFVISYAT